MMVRPLDRTPVTFVEKVVGKSRSDPGNDSLPEKFLSQSGKFDLPRKSSCIK
jgi:hypothetical protein